MSLVRTLKIRSLTRQEEARIDNNQGFDLVGMWTM
jgi:hypothetical protein